MSLITAASAPDWFFADTKIGRLRKRALELLEEHDRDGAIPTSVRFLFYELVQLRVLSKEKTGARRPDQDLCEAIFDLREQGIIPWDWIVDETRALRDYTGTKSVKDWLLDISLHAAKLDPWRGKVPLTLTESRSLAGVLDDMCRDYRIKIAPTNGQVGGFLRTKIIPLLRAGDLVLYMGDWDWCGGQIEANTRAVLERSVGPLRWERLALTEEQVDEHRLPKIIKHDKRYLDGKPHEAVETEALRQTVIVDILRDRLDELLPEPLARVQERERRQRAAVRRLLNGGAS
ncbi:MAG TPA: hypothetical protein VF913_12425 [Xanthobacteraceae bacterium]